LKEIGGRYFSRNGEDATSQGMLIVDVGRILQTARVPGAAETGPERRDNEPEAGRCTEGGADQKEEGEVNCVI